MEMQDRFVTRTSAQEAIDVGLREHMLRVYNYMASGLALSGIVAYLIANTGVKSVFFTTAASGQVGLTLIWAYTAVMGVSLATILLQFTGASVARVFFITAGTFAAMSLYGYTTKRDLSQFGSFLFMGLIGLILASVVNIFVASSALQFAISVIGVLLFVGLTAYDTQKIKEIYLESDSSEIAGKKALMGALSLYLDFINLFTFLMQLLGTRRD
jgi:FtsH-binding integral membrane protein